MADVTDQRQPTPLWQWVLWAVSPALAYDLIASSSLLSEDLAGLSMFVGMATPLITLIALVVIANRYYKERGNPSQGARLLFVLGFGVLNALLWFGGCMMTLSNLNFH